LFCLRRPEIILKWTYTDGVTLIQSQCGNDVVSFRVRACAAHGLTCSLLPCPRTPVHIKGRTDKGDDMILAEITQAMRSAILTMAAQEMDRMRDADMNAWLTPEYVELENLAYALTVAAAE